MILIMIGHVNIPSASNTDLTNHTSEDISSGSHGLKYNEYTGKLQRLVNDSYQNIDSGSSGIPINDAANTTSYTATINIVNGKPVLVY